VQLQPVRLVASSNHADGIVQHFERGRDVWKDAPIRTGEPQLTIRQSLELKTLFVHRTVMSPTQQG